MVFIRSRPVLARYDVSPHMIKWWKAKRTNDGQVSGCLRKRHFLQFIFMYTGNVVPYRHFSFSSLYLHFCNNNQITRMLSPYEQQAIMPWIRTFPKRVSFCTGIQYGASLHSVRISQACSDSFMLISLSAFLG